MSKKKEEKTLFEIALEQTRLPTAKKTVKFKNKVREDKADKVKRKAKHKKNDLSDT